MSEALQDSNTPLSNTILVPDNQFQALDEKAEALFTTVKELLDLTEAPTAVQSKIAREARLSFRTIRTSYDKVRYSAGEYFRKRKEAIDSSARAKIR